MNQIYGEPETRSYIKLTLTTILLAMAVIANGLFAIVAISITALMSPSVTGNQLLHMLAGMRLTVPFSISARIACIYRYGPSRVNARWSWLTPGAFFATVGCFAGSWLLGWYVSNLANYNAA